MYEIWQVIIFSGSVFLAGRRKGRSRRIRKRSKRRGEEKGEQGRGEERRGRRGRRKEGRRRRRVLIPVLSLLSKLIIF